MEKKTDIGKMSMWCKGGLAQGTACVVMDFQCNGICVLSEPLLGEE